MPDLAAVGVNLAVTAAVALAVLLVTFAIGTTKDRHRLVDTAWGLGFTAVAAATLVLSQGYGDPVRRWTIAALTAVWGVRLAVHLAVRNWGEPEDRRYERMLTKAPGSRDAYALRVVYLLQALLVWLVSLPVQVGQYDPDPPGPLFWAGAGLWTLGFVFETVGDAQLKTFRDDPGNAGRVLATGLWRYTRHPNYFGDACVWWGLFVMACASWPGAATVIAPLVMTWFLAAKTGKPLLEEHLRTARPGYADYVERTSGFVPLPPRRAPR